MSKAKTYNVQSCGQFYVKGVSHYGPVNNIVLEDQEVEVLKACGITVVSTVKPGVVVNEPETKKVETKTETTTDESKTDAPTENKPTEKKNKNK